MKLVDDGHSRAMSGRTVAWARSIRLSEGLAALARRRGMDGERVDAGLELLGEGGVDQAVTLQPALATKSLRHDPDPEMGFSAGPMAGVSRMPIGFVDDFQAYRGESLESTSS